VLLQKDRAQVLENGFLHKFNAYLWFAVLVIWSWTVLALMSGQIPRALWSHWCWIYELTANLHTRSLAIADQCANLWTELRPNADGIFDSAHLCSSAIYRVRAARWRAPSIPEGYEELASRASRLTVRICTDASGSSIQLNHWMDRLLLRPVSFT